MTDEKGENSSTVNGNVATALVDEYQRLALYDVFKGIVSKLVNEDDMMKE